MKKGEKTETVLDWGLWIGWLYFAKHCVVATAAHPPMFACPCMQWIHHWYTELAWWILLSFSSLETKGFTLNVKLEWMIKSHMCNFTVPKAIALIDLQSYYSLHALCSCLGDPFYNTGLKGITIYSSTGQITSHIECTGQTITDYSFQINSPGVLTLQWKGSQLHSCIKGTL